MGKNDSLVEKLFYLAKKGTLENHQERELIKSAAIRIQTLQAEKYLTREPKKPTWRLGKPCCGDCGTVMPKWSNFCPYCGKKVLWDD